MSHTQLIKTAHLTQNVRVEGSGPPLLFLGGSNFDLSIRARVFDSALVNHFTVAAADPRGLGSSDSPDGNWNMQDYALDALDLMDALGWDTACVLGESFGAMVALELALLAPERLLRLGLAAGAPGGDGGASYPIHLLLHIKDQRERVIKSLNIQDKRFEQLLQDDPVEAANRIKQRIQNDNQFLMNTGNGKGYPRLLAARAKHDCWNRLNTITSDTLIIAGKFDHQAPMDRAEAMVERIPNAQLLTFSEGHNVCFESPGPVEAIINRWAVDSNQNHS